MIIRKDPSGGLVLIGQTDHSRFVGQLAAHWGNGNFETLKPYDSVVRAATFHDYGWLRYETSPLVAPQSGEPYAFLQVPMTNTQLGSYQWALDWMADIDPYSGLIVSMHRTGLWKGRYQTIKHPAGRYNLTTLSPETIKVRTFETLHALFLGGNRPGPLIMVIEDLQWIDRASEEYLGSLADRVVGGRIVLAATGWPKDQDEAKKDGKVEA